jgi:hypothetical protein
MANMTTNSVERPLSRNLWIDTVLREPLMQAKLDSLPALLAHRDGTTVSRAVKRPVLRLSLPVEGQATDFYLKQFRISWRWLLTELLKRRLPLLSAPRRELLLLDAIAALQIPVMQTRAWGERKCGPLPLAGVLLVEAVKGREYVSAYAAARPRERRRLRWLHGQLVGLLHAAGILSKVRPHDLFVSGSDWRDCRRALTVIDRERGLLLTAPLTPHKRAAQLADLLVKSGLTIDMATPREARAFLAGYRHSAALEQSASGEGRALAALVSATLARARELIERHAPSAAYRAAFARDYGKASQADGGAP